MASASKLFTNDDEEVFDETRQLVPGTSTTDQNSKANGAARDYLKDTQVKISGFYRISDYLFLSEELDKIACIRCVCITKTTLLY